MVPEDIINKFLEVEYWDKRIHIYYSYKIELFDSKTNELIVYCYDITDNVKSWFNFPEYSIIDILDGKQIDKIKLL